MDANAALLDDTKFLVLAENAEREIADHRLEQPAGDNALETYRELMTQSPNDVRVTDLGARLRALFWILWSDAVAAHRQEEADHYFDVIETSFSGVPMAPVSEPQHLDPLVVLHEVSGDSGYPTTRRVPGEPTTRRVPAEDVSPSRDVPEITSLAIRRGDELMKLGDIMAARRFYELAASAGVSRAATAVGKTFDPFYLRQAGVQGIQANLILARQWYEKAMRDGDPEAAPLLDRISVR